MHYHKLVTNPTAFYPIDYTPKMEATVVTAIPVEDIPKYEGLLKQAKEKFDELRGWKEKAEGASPEFEEELRTALGYSSAAFNILRDDQRFNRYDARQLREATTLFGSKANNT